MTHADLLTMPIAEKIQLMESLWHGVRMTHQNIQLISRQFSRCHSNFHA